MSNPDEQLSPSDQAAAAELINILLQLPTDSTTEHVIAEIQNGTAKGLRLLRAHKEVMNRVKGEIK